ncbi:hypothetical protein ACWKT5_24360 [Streptomyces avermitilis]
MRRTPVRESSSLILSGFGRRFPARGQTRAPHARLRRRYNNARHRNILAALGRASARIRSERGVRWSVR